MQHPYGARDVERLLRLSRSTIRALVDAGFVTPARGSRKAMLFSFQDLIVLRTAQALADAKVPAKRITRSLLELRKQLPESMPLSGLSIGAVGEHVVVRDGTGQRHAESGQYLLAFEGDPDTGALRIIESPPSTPGEIEGDDETPDVDALLERALDLEIDDVDAAVATYEQAIALDPDRLDARINLGRLLHESDRRDAAERVYRAATEVAGDDSLLHYNLGVLLEDLGRQREAISAYEIALRADPALADCCFNLALLYRKEDRPRDAIRYMSQYRRLLAAQA